MVWWFYETKSPSAFPRNRLGKFGDRAWVAFDDANSCDRSISNLFADFRSRQSQRQFRKN
jgi:hypothetical protein